MSNTDKKTDLDKVLDTEMKSLIGTRNWNIWKKDEPEMYSTICSAMYHYGEQKWKQAQKSAAEFTRKKHKSVVSFTPFQP